MNVIEQIIDVAKQNNGVITAAMLTDKGINRGNLKYLVDAGRIEKVSRGVYTLPEILEDEVFNLQNRFKRGVYSFETALFLWNLTDRTPVRYTMTFPKGYNLSGPKEENIRCVQYIEELYENGIAKVVTPGGNMVNCYCMEKTLCDILRPRMNVDIQLISEAFIQYMLRKDRNIPLLSDYSKKLRVENKVRSYLEVLL